MPRLRAVHSHPAGMDEPNHSEMGFSPHPGCPPRTSRRTDRHIPAAVPLATLGQLQHHYNQRHIEAGLMAMASLREDCAIVPLSCAYKIRKRMMMIRMITITPPPIYMDTTFPVRRTVAQDTMQYPYQCPTVGWNAVHLHNPDGSTRSLSMRKSRVERVCLRQATFCGRIKTTMPASSGERAG